MKKTSIRIVLGLALSAMVFTACKKDKDEAVTVTKENLVGTYKLTEMKMKVTGAPEMDIFNLYFESCQRDDTYTLAADFKVQVKDQGTVCADPNNYESTWSMDGNYVEIDGTAGKVKSFDGKTLVLEAEGTEGGMTGTVTAKFVKQ
ncbi:lipocalin family protein [Paraflavitalea sp. CAU 1676]|uniref:lipocalin family protein n=1 Tax=Paraflavitalea sp. CAU 1676 TaxID=3032598 RepID=UPI0023DC664F|nr:lipocalin family protein [Paraflavitalea sp. CAU 1676]MDF2193662.1 lipocalin family protein [Paraflavitalea sp. CAU 1676]